MWWECNMVCKLTPYLLFLPRFSTKVTPIPTKVFWENRTDWRWWLTLISCGITCFAQNQAGGNIWQHVLTCSIHKPQSLQIFELLNSCVCLLWELTCREQKTLPFNKRSHIISSKSNISKVFFFFNLSQTTVYNKFWYSVTLFLNPHFSFFITCIN